MTAPAHLNLANVDGRCAEGFAPQQHPTYCPCGHAEADSEWSLFVSVLRNVARDGVVHQGDVRPLLKGRMDPKHIGPAYQRATREGLLTVLGREPSTDVAGRNTHHDSRYFRLAVAS